MELGRTEHDLLDALDREAGEQSGSSSDSDASDQLLSSVPHPSSVMPEYLTEFRREVGTMDSESDHEDFDDNSASSWSGDSVTGAMVPERHVRTTIARGPLPRPSMPDWSSPSSLDAAVATVAATSTTSTDSTDSACGPSSQSPIRRKRQSAGRRPRRMQVSSHREVPLARDPATVGVFPCSLDFGNVVQWCRQQRTVSVHNPGNFTAQLHGGIIADGNENAGAFALQLDSGWPTLPPMSTVVLQVELAPSVPGPCQATLVVHATTDGVGSAPVAAVCNLRGSCAVSPLHLALERGNEGSATSDSGGLHSLRLQLQNTAVRSTDLLINADEPFQTQTKSLTLRPGDAHVAIIERQSLQSDPIQAQCSWLTVVDKANDNTHRLLLCEVSSTAAATTTRPASFAALGDSPPLADNISARASGPPKWYGLVGVPIQVQIEIHNAHSDPVRLIPRLNQSEGDTAVNRSSGTSISLGSTEPVVATPSVPSTHVVSICTAQSGTHTVELQLLCTDASSVVVPLTVQIIEEDWVVDSEADALEFGAVEGHGSHFVSTQVHNRTPVPTDVRIFLNEEVGASAGTKSRCFFAALGHPDEGISGANALRLESGDRIQLPPCSDTTGSVTIHVGLQPPDNIHDGVLVDCHGSLRFESLRDGEERKTASLRLHAQVGTAKLQVPGGEQLLLFCIESLASKTCTQDLSLRNYGNVNACCNLSTTNKSFCVDPQAVVIGPSEVVDVQVTFTADVTPMDNGPEQGPDTITGHLEVNTKHMLFQIPLRAEIRTHPDLVCSAPVVNWGCVDIGVTQRQSIVVRNRSNFRCEIFAAVADLDSPDLSRPSPFMIEGAEIVQLNRHSGHEFVLTFAPVDVSFVRHGLFIRDKCGRTYKIPLLGAGGKSQFMLELEHGDRAIDFSSGSQKAGQVKHKTLTVRNTGTRTGFVHVDCTSLRGVVSVGGGPRNAASVVVAPNKSHEFVLEMSQKGSVDSTSARPEAAVEIYCGDELARRRRRQCRHARWSEELGSSGTSSLGRDAFDDTFCNEQFFAEPNQGGVAGAHEDTVFDDFFDEPIFEAQLKRLSVPLIVGRIQETAQTPHSSSTTTVEARNISKNKATRKDTVRPMASRVPLGECQVENTSETSLPSQATAEKNVEPATTPRHPECLHTHMSGLEFPPTATGESATMQLELCNGHRREITVVVAVQPPFVVRHQRFRIRSRSRVRLPVKFNPEQNGPVQQVMRIETSLSGNKEMIEMVLSGTGDDFGVSTEKPTT